MQVPANERTEALSGDEHPLVHLAGFSPKREETVQRLWLNERGALALQAALTEFLLAIRYRGARQSVVQTVEDHRHVTTVLELSDQAGFQVTKP